MLANHLKIFYFCFLCFLVVSIFGDIAEEEDVLILNSLNFNDAINSYKNILVEFYAPWCGHCQALEPEFRAAAKQLKESNSKIRLAKVDATVQKEIAANYKISGYPSLKFFISGSPVDYNGPRKADGIVNWLIKKSGPPATFIEDEQDLEPFVNPDSLAVVGYFTSEEEAAPFLTVAHDMETVDFGLVLKPELFIANISQPSIVIFKNYDENQVIYEGDFTVNMISKFVKIHKFELVSEFSQKLSENLFDGSINKHLIYFAPKGEKSTESTLIVLKTIAKTFRGDILIITVDSGNDEFNSILEFFGITQEHIPCVRAVILSEEVKRFKQDKTDLSEESLMLFVNKFVGGTLYQDLKKQETPEDWDSKPVKLITGSNYVEVIENRKSKKALVEFYAPWCGHCKALAPIWEQLGDHFKDDSEVIIAKVDSTLNEFTEIPITSYPTIKFFPQNSGEIFEYKGTRNLESFIQFIETNGISEIDSDVEEGDDDHQSHEDL